MIQYFSVFQILEIVTIILIAYFGPSANVRIKLKTGIVHKDENITPTVQSFHLVQLPKNGSFLGLTNMEMTVLSFLSEGHSSKEISEKLFVTTGAVYFHLGNIKNKLQISKTSHLVKHAVENREKIQKTNKTVKSIVSGNEKL